MEEILNSLPEPMQINTTALIIAGIFLVLILVLTELIFKPLVSILDDRKRRIEEGAEAQKQSMKTVDEKMMAYRAALVDARRKAQANRQAILQESEKGRGQLTASSKQQAAAQIAEVTARLNVQVAEAKASLKQESQEIAQRIVGSVLSRA